MNMTFLPAFVRTTPSLNSELGTAWEGRNLDKEDGQANATLSGHRSRSEAARAR
jgi:hypothetical protein